MSTEQLGPVEVEAPAAQVPLRSGLGEVGWSFLKLGLFAFGGPIAHLGYFREEFVTKRRWLDDEVYGDLVALCQFLPGPASSQVVFALGMKRAGLAGALIASLCFTLPSALMMISFAYGVTSMGNLESAGWLHGLKLAAVAVVAQVVWGMGKNLCPDRPRVTICLVSAGAVLVFPDAFCQVVVIAMGTALGWLLYRHEVQIPDPAKGTIGVRSHLAAALALALFWGLLALTPVLAAATDWKLLSVFDSFYRAGSLVFGGGHVVLPLLRAEVVPHGWVNDDQFLAGYGAAQAVPGPLFTFSGYLGAIMHAGPYAWASGLWCLFAIFLPAWLLIGGALPFWQSLRAKAWTQAGLRGANSAVVGVLLAALYNPVVTEGVRNAKDVAAALTAFGLVYIWRVPPWLMVLLMALAGQWIL